MARFIKDDVVVLPFSFSDMTQANPVSPLYTPDPATAARQGGRVAVNLEKRFTP